MKCPGCDLDIRDKKDNFCSNCGQRLRLAATQDAEAKSLGSDVENAAGSEKRTSESTEPPEKKRKKDQMKISTEEAFVLQPKNINVDAQDRLLIHFHAILSKDFKFDRQTDRIFIQAGCSIGAWGENIVQIHPTSNFGEQEYLVEGKLVTSKSKVAHTSIPYKYVIFRGKKKKYKYEYIYKPDSQDDTNRCLFVKDKFLSNDGEWHQYDDIIRKEPKNTITNSVKELFSQQKKSLIEGRKIAGQKMLDTIFLLLKNWSEVNLKNFQIQLNQFFDVYSEPFVYEKRSIKWDLLGCGREDIKQLLKTFMQSNMSFYVQDPFKAAVIQLTVCWKYGISLDADAIEKLTLTFTKKNCWETFLNDVSCLPNLAEMLMVLMNKAKTQHLPHWILVLPLVHRLKGSTKPYEELPLWDSRSEQSWAGLEGIHNLKQISSADRKNLIDLMNSHLHLEMDVMTVRSWLYLTTINELTNYSKALKPELLDILKIFTLKVPQVISRSNFEEVSITIAHICTCLKNNEYRHFTESYRKDCLDVAVKLLDKIGQGVVAEANNIGIFVSCIRLVESVTDFISKAEDLDTSETAQKQSLTRNLLVTALDIVRRKISHSFKGSLLSDIQEIKMWNTVLSIKFKDDTCTAEWTNKLTKDLEGRYKKESEMKQVQFYCKHKEQLSRSFSNAFSCIERCALDAVTSLCQTGSEGNLFEIEGFEKFGNLISVVIEKSCEKIHCEDAETILGHLLSWPASKYVFQLYADEEKEYDQLSEVANRIISKAISAFTSVVNQLVHGDINIGLLNIILEKPDTFLELLQTEGLNNQYKNASKIKRLLQQRENEVGAVYHEKELLDILVTMAHNLKEFITVDVDAIKKKQQMNIDKMPLNIFMKIDQTSLEKAVTYFDLDEDVRDMAKKMYTFRDGYVFKMCWQQHVGAYAKNENVAEEKKDVSLKIVHEKIFVGCFDTYKEIYTSLRDGSIMLEKINELLKDFKAKYEQLKQDMEIMCLIDPSADKRWIVNRGRQIEEFHELHLAVDSAEIIMRVKTNLNLQGDFSVLDSLIELNQADLKTKQLNDIDSNLIQAKMDLMDTTEPHKACLRQLGSSGNFVTWVKKELEDINELKVFVDLASISAGENDMEVDRVACFHDAVLGYSSMLFELKPESDFYHFKKIVQKLWKALQNDCNLPKKLRDSARHLEWLKSVKDSHGSVEKSSLSLASAINKKGFYIISALSGKKPSLDTALQLQITEELDNSQHIRNYSLEDLRELQNKLMLMSGKGDHGMHEVDYFTEVFDSVQRLSEAFLALYTAGNPLFRHWEAQIRCCANSAEPSIIVNFNFNSAFSAVNIEGNLEEQLPNLCRKMERCLEYWMDFVDKQRSQHYYLNYYTAEQIVYLCSHLSQENVPHLNDQTLMMLSLVRPNCSVTDLTQAWHEFQSNLASQSQKQNNEIELQTFAKLESEFSDASNQFDLPPSLKQKASALDTFELIWNFYMKDMERALPHILDLRTLGRLLAILGNRATQRVGECEQDISNDHTMYISRKMPSCLTTGKPNLVVCPHENILTSCISIYMESKNEPLPTMDEVLLCTSTTQYEQVELFLRRCLSPGYRGHKIYSLLYADLLPYDVSAKAERFFQSIKEKGRKDYRLIFFCSSEREHTFFPSAFSQYKVHVTLQAQLTSIQEYLHKQYVVPEDQCSAACAFKDRLCVGIVSSKRAGVGKSLFIKRLYHKLKDSTEKTTAKNCIRLIEPTIDENAVLQSLLNCESSETLTVFHFDVTASVEKGINDFIFKLLFLRYLTDSEGKVWKCTDKHLYLVEILERSKSSSHNTQNFSFTNIFPNIFCRPPKEVLDIELRKKDVPNVVSNEDPLMDDKEFKSAAFQRPYQYLTRFHLNADLSKFTYNKVEEGSHAECLEVLLRHCGVMDPSWTELRNFAWFLNVQLQDCETSVFCNADLTGDTLIGFKRFVVDFMILMARDFATPSLCISDQSPGRSQTDCGAQNEDLAPFLIRKKWETEPHPYIFFNDDHMSMTFIGFHLKRNGHNRIDAIDPVSGRIIKENIMSKRLHDELLLQGVPFNTDFDKLSREDKIQHLCNVLGIKKCFDPDQMYELTTDNILKILAIHMRFRCGIPVIIMGETGCGKTRLVKFLCELQKSGVDKENMKLVKVHGGSTSDMIYAKVREAEGMAITNKNGYGFDSVLFFDEANTTEAISSIKEVLCDKTVKGQALTPESGLHIIAACNPYRKHTEEMIKRLESAGLGYRVRDDKTDKKLGSTPLRQLVYRVHALPPSMIPLVWDFGQLNNDTEKIYIQLIVQRVVESHEINADYIQCIVNVLSASQQFMRKKKNECSFVSLRDVERCMQVFAWFYGNHTIFIEEIQKNDSTQSHEARDAVLWSLIMATGVCYNACLENKDSYRQEVSRTLPAEYTPQKIEREITLIHNVFLNGVPMEDTIARNNALKENLFMMVVCIELRIPLFVVGKPGSSKSLSKTLVADAMQGLAAHSELYKRLKQIHLVSFQCSPHSTPEGIINTFKQCGRFQEGKNLNEYVSVVVLDEIGLAEDSQKMPLKTLHPLLEEGCIDDDPLPHKKVGFIGISNWALDPAKMNRGIFVSRGDPDKRELVKSAEGICSSDKMILEKVRDFFQPFAEAYLEICQTQGNGFYGLRDYYSLIKMIFAVGKTSQSKPSEQEIIKAVLRNFSGKDDLDAVAVFKNKLQITPNYEAMSAIEFVKENIQAIGQDKECRYLLVLTKNYAALQILQQIIFHESRQPEIIFGSSFLKDQQYTQICRNINRVKICMETGQTVVLLNLQNLYESLYDALNQYYVFLGGQKYVDLGLGTHRVKCRVHKDFRLIVIEEREVVYKQFPIPLINRLEKHYVDVHSVLKAEQKRTVSELEKWVKLFASFSSHQTVKVHEYKPAEVFIGYQSDTCASVVLQVLKNQKNAMEPSNPEKTVLDEAKLLLLKCATPDSVVRLDCSELPKGETEYLAKVYNDDLNNSCLVDYLLAHIREEQPSNTQFTEMTTFSRLLTTNDLKPLEQRALCVELMSVHQFDTEHSFLKKIRNFLTAECNLEPNIKILIIQCNYDESSLSSNLVASAKHSSINEVRKVLLENTGNRVFVYFISRLQRMMGGTSYAGFQGGSWRSVHIDDLRRSNEMVSDIKTLQQMTLSQLFETKISQPEAMEVDDDDSYMMTDQDNMNSERNQHDVLDTTTLLESCVQRAVGLLWDQHESDLRSTQRVNILLSLLEDDEMKEEFTNILKRHIHVLLAANVGNTRNWVMREASNIDALQEGGTFRNTLWKHIQAEVVPVLAHLVSIIDRNQNLDILLDYNYGSSLKRLWLDIFGNETFLEVPHLTQDHNSESKTILVQNNITQKSGTGCRMPFSWWIKDYLEDLWVHALQHEGQTQQQFDDFFWSTSLGFSIKKQNQDAQREIFDRYLHDYVSLTMNVTGPEEVQLLCGALTCCVNELKIKLEGADRQTPLTWVHAAYHKFKNRLQNLSRMICIEPRITADLLRNPSLMDGSEMVLDVYAALACVEHLEPTILDTDDQRQTWLRLVHKFQVPIELVCTEESIGHYGERSKANVIRVRDAWNRIICHSLFVEHMLLGLEELEHKLVQVVLEHTHKLWKILEYNTDLKTKDSFEAVIGLLKSCKDRAVECLFRNGLPQCSACKGDPVDPVCLPCNHMYCLACIRQWLVPHQMNCPLTTCMQQVDDNFAVVPANDIGDDINKHAQFRMRCNAFFVVLVSSLCFKDNSPPSADVIYALLSYHFMGINNAPIFGVQSVSKTVTKEFSPFDEALDKSPVVRSVVLKLLLKYSLDQIKEYLQDHLATIEKSKLLDVTEKRELYSLYINCFEDSMFEKLCLPYERDFLVGLLTSELQSLDAVTVDGLQQVARVRLDLDIAANLCSEEAIASEIWTGQTSSSDFLKSVKTFCSQSGNNWHRVYLIRKIASQYGVERVHNLLKVKQMHWLFPEEILIKVQETPMDQFLVCGMDYQNIRNAVAKAVRSGALGDLDESCKKCKNVSQSRAVYLLLALYREVTTWYQDPDKILNPKDKDIDLWKGYIQNSQVLTTPELKAFAQALVTNDLGPLSLSPDASTNHCAFTELTVHLAAVLLCGDLGILEPLQQLAFAPATMKAAYLPTMPDMLRTTDITLVQEAEGCQRLRWYSCPNGHPFAIGECGRPVEMSECAHCGSKIGGLRHEPTEGFRDINLGHILGDPGRRDNPDMLDTKNFSPVPFTVMRMVTHLAMLFGLCKDAQAILTIIRPQVENPTEFLLGHLRKDQAQLMKSFEKGADDTVSSVHLFICSLLPPPKASTPNNNKMSTNEDRDEWEKEISLIFVNRLKNLDRLLKEARTRIHSDDRISASPIVKILFEDPQLFLGTLPENSPIQSSTVWSCREKVSLFGLSHILEKSCGKDTFPFLLEFLRREAEYRLVKVLPDILALQKKLVKKYQHVGAPFRTIDEFLQNSKSEPLKAWYKKHIDTFLMTWNQLRTFLATNGEIKLPPAFCERDLDISSDFRLLLPSRHGPGLCSTALVRYLIALHNGLVYTVDKLTGEETSYKVSPADLTDLHVIRYELDRDLMPLVLSNTQYSIEKGQETIREYDFLKIQQQIVSRFLLGKPLITEKGIPTIINRHDRDYKAILEDVKAKIIQEPLQTLSQAAISTTLDSYSEVCEALSTVEIALGFLAKTGGDPRMKLSYFLEEVLRMGNQTPPHIIEALSMFSLKHCTGLWQLLRSLKSEGLMKIKRDPFGDMSERYKQALGEDERRLLTDFISKNNADSFLLEVHEFIILELSKPNAADTFKAEWSVKENLVPYLMYKNQDIPCDVEDLFPDEICLCHLTEAWKLCISFKQERTNRQ